MRAGTGMLESGMLIDRLVGPGDTIPEVNFFGSSDDCAAGYVDWVLREFPNFDLYLEPLLTAYRKPDPYRERIFCEYAPGLWAYLQALGAALENHGYELGGGGFPPCPVQSDRQGGGCTSFAVEASYCRGGSALAGQTKDPPINRLEYHRVFHFRIDGLPEMLYLGYPGELLGLGLWGNGNSLWRNDLESSGDNPKGLALPDFGLLVLHGPGIDFTVELARRFGVAGRGNVLFADGTGRAVTIEFNSGGTAVGKISNGILVHANHPVLPLTRRCEAYQPETERSNSRYRVRRLREILGNAALHGTLDRKTACRALGDHCHFPGGICRHCVGGDERIATTAAVVVEPGRGCLYACKGPPCSGRWRRYRFSGT